MRELARAIPSVVWHLGRITARYRDSSQVCRSIFPINSLLGSIGAEGGLPLSNTPGNVGRILDGEVVEVANNAQVGGIKVKLADCIHPEAVFVVHGFGHRFPVESRAIGKGILDNNFMAGGLDLWDPAGGGITMQEHFVEVRKVL